MKNAHKHLKRVRRTASVALRAFIRAEKRLTKVNARIDGHIADVESAISELHSVKSALAIHHASNAHTLGHIGTVLGDKQGGINVG